jgi:hypothetical protein
MIARFDDYDSPWKDAVEHYLPEFLAFFFPAAAAAIDWSQDYEFLDQELHAVVQDAELGRRFVDKLVRVTLTGGAETWILVHIEVQGSREAEFAERMFVYNYRLFDRYRRPVASLAVLADDVPGCGSRRRSASRPWAAGTPWSSRPSSCLTAPAGKTNC